jgi:peptidoglycan/LPS O-acetylase OafA/YrhL
MQPLQSGVTLFFVLSGFLLYQPFINGSISLRRYFRNRAFRILPAYWVVLLVSGLLLGGTIVRATGHGNVAGYLRSPKLLAMNLALVQGYDPNTVFTGILPSWSLVVEVAFYVSLPLAAIALARRNVLVPPLMFIGVGIIAKLALTVVGLDGMRTLSPTWSATVAHSFIGHIDLFGYGMAAAVAYTRWRRTSTPRWISGGLVGRALAYIGLPCAVLGFYFLPAYLYDSLVAAFAALLLLRVTAPTSRARLLRSRLAQASGRVSYSVFLWNYPTLAFLATRGLLVHGGTAALLVDLAIGGSVISVLATMTYRFVEAPCMRLRGHRAEPGPTAQPAPSVG